MTDKTNENVLMKLNRVEDLKISDFFILSSLCVTILRSAKTVATLKVFKHYFSFHHEHFIYF
jgi:hypothetical protein